MIYCGKINDGSREFYNINYDILRTPDFDENTRVLKPEHGIHYLGNPKNKVCRFCRKNEKEVTFKKIAHAFPESIGNSTLATYYECDTCNQFFGSNIENEFGNFFILFHSIMQISGKDGRPACGFKISCDKRTDECMKHCINIFVNESDLLCVGACKEVPKDYINLTNDSITISKPIGKCNLIAVFKAIVKMAITVMPKEELISFSNTIDWLREKEHKNIYSTKRLLVRYRMIPGFHVVKYPRFVIYRRKKTVWNKPYLVYNLIYGCYSILIEVPRDNDESNVAEFEKIPFPPMNYYYSKEGVYGGC